MGVLGYGGHRYSHQPLAPRRITQPHRHLPRGRGMHIKEVLKPSVKSENKTLAKLEEGEKAEELKDSLEDDTVFHVSTQHPIVRESIALQESEPVMV